MILTMLVMRWGAHVSKMITSPAPSVSAVTGTEAKGEREVVWHSNCGIGTEVFSPS